MNTILRVASCFLALLAFTLHSQADSWITQLQDHGDFYQTSATNQRRLLRVANEFSIRLQQGANWTNALEKIRTLPGFAGASLGLTISYRTNATLFTVSVPPLQNPGASSNLTKAEWRLATLRDVPEVRAANPVFSPADINSGRLFVSGTMIVALTETADPVAYAATKGNRSERLAGTRSTFVVAITEGTFEAQFYEVAREANRPEVRYAEPNFIMLTDNPLPSGNVIDVGQVLAVPRIMSVTAQSNGLNLLVHGRGQEAIRLEQSPDLVNWTTVTNATGTGAGGYHLEMSSPEHRAFFRAVLDSAIAAP